MKLAVPILAALALLSAPTADARGGHAPSSHSTATHAYNPRAATGMARNNGHGRIQRSVAAKDAFKHAHPCPSTGRSSGACPGYVIDHVIALKRGGPDAPSNMQWQTIQAAKAKDRVE